MTAQFADRSASYGAGDRLAATAADLACVAVPAFLLCVLLVSFQPFALHSVIVNNSEAGGDAINQIGYSALGIVAFAGMLMLAAPARLAAVLDPVWLAMVAILVLSAFVSPDPVSALKSIAFTFIVVLVGIAVLTIPRDAEQLRRVFLVGICAAIALAYFGVIFLPDISVHGADSLEPQHAGLWRGYFSHKNIAGPVMAVFAFFGIYFIRTGARFTGLAVTIFAIVFVLHTGSKTTIGFLPVVIGIVMVGTVFGLRGLVVFMAIIAMLTIGALTVGSVIWQPLADLAAAASSDPTYTGRTTLWAFGLENIQHRFWTGYGFDGFWLKPVVTESALPFDAEWDYREIVHGHDNYIDIMLNLGVPAGLFVIWALSLRPLGAYMRSARDMANRRLADLFAMIVIFAMLNSLLEAFWFRRDDPIWIMLVIGIFGLRMTARLPYPSPRR